jgi:hypothetical protein
MWTGLVWLRMGTDGELLWIRYWTFGFHEMLGNYCVFFLFLRVAPVCHPQQYFSNVFFCYYYIPAKCFGPYGPSSCGTYIGIGQFLRTYFSTTDPLFLFGLQPNAYIYIYIYIYVCVCVFIWKLMSLGSSSRRVRRPNNLTAIWADCLDNVEFLTSHNPTGLHGRLRG